MGTNTKLLIKLFTFCLSNLLIKKEPMKRFHFFFQRKKWFSAGLNFQLRIDFVSNIGREAINSIFIIRLKDERMKNKSQSSDFYFDINWFRSALMRLKPKKISNNNYGNWLFIFISPLFYQFIYFLFFLIEIHAISTTEEIKTN